MTISMTVNVHLLDVITRSVHATLMNVKRLMRIEEVDHNLSGEKRQHFPAVIYYDCPECGEERKMDLRESYLSHPVWGESMRVPVFCVSCDELEPITELELVPELEINEKS